MPLKFKKTNKKQNSATTLTKRASMKSVRKPTVSVATPPDFDDSEQNLDSDKG